MQKRTAAEQEKVQEYQKLVKERAPKSKTLFMCCKAFFVGGAICCIGTLIHDAGEVWWGLEGELLSSFTSIVMVFLGAMLTGLGLYDKIGSFAGAGSIVPITGFANSMVAPAMEFRSEGLVLGLGAKLFSIAGPVLTYGVTSSMIVGLLSLLFK